MPPFVGYAIKDICSPSQTESDDVGETITPTGNELLTLMMIGLEYAGLFVAQLETEVSVQVIISPFVSDELL